MGPAPRARLRSRFQDHHPRRLRPHLRPLHRGLRHHPLRRLHRPVRLRLHQSGRHAGIQLGPGLPSYPLPPQINPSFDNNNSTYYWQGQDATRMPEILTYTFSIQRQLSTSTVLEADYNATEGVHLQTGLVNINQVPMSVVNGLISQLGAAGGGRVF